MAYKQTNANHITFIDYFLAAVFLFFRHHHCSHRRRSHRNELYRVELLSFCFRYPMNELNERNRNERSNEKKKTQAQTECSFSKINHHIRVEILVAMENTFHFYTLLFDSRIIFVVLRAYSLRSVSYCCCCYRI